MKQITLPVTVNIPIQGKGTALTGSKLCRQIEEKEQVHGLSGGTRQSIQRSKRQEDCRRI